MLLAHDPFPCSDSPIRRLDPRWKLAGLMVAVVTAALVRSLSTLGLVLLAALALAALSRLHWRWYLARLASVFLFVGLFAVPLPFFLRGGSAWPVVGPFSVSWHGLSFALLLLGKAAAILTFLLVLLVTAPVDATLKAAHTLRVPGLLVQLAMLTGRYIAVLANELGCMRVALRVRGYRNRMSRHTYRTIGHVTGTLLVRASERAERVGQAMRCRGFDGRFRSLAEFRTRAVDVPGLFSHCRLLRGLALLGSHERIKEEGRRVKDEQDEAARVDPWSAQNNGDRHLEGSEPVPIILGTPDPLYLHP